MAKTKQRGEAATTPASDDLTLERVRAWLEARVARFEEYCRQFPSAAGATNQLGSLLREEIDTICSRLRAADDIARHLREIQVLTVAFGPHSSAEPSVVPSSRRSAASTTPNGAPPNRERWRKRPPSKQERDDLRMELLRARAAGPEALARAKREIGKRHGLHPRWVASLLNTCTGKRYALNFAARMVSRAPQAQRQAQLVVQLSNLLGLRQDRILKTVRNIEHG